MQFFATILAIVNLLSLVAAYPPWMPYGGPGKKQDGACLDRSTGETIVKEFGTLLTAYTNETAENLLNPENFSDTSDGINFLTGTPLGTVTFPSQMAFILGQGSQPAIAWDLLGVDSVTCDGVIAFRWQAPIGEYPVKGINIIYTSLNKGGDVKSIGPGGWQITQIFSEFNSAAWTLDIGGTCKTH